jgi:hypothetical protein
MTLWHSRIADFENDHQILFDSDQHTLMRKAASVANLWPRPSTSPSTNHTASTSIVHDRSPFPPRVSSLNRVPPVGWDCGSGSAATPARTISKRPATAHASATVDSSLAFAGGREPGTAHASSGIARASAGASPGTSGLFGAQCQQGSCSAFLVDGLFCFGVAAVRSIRAGEGNSLMRAFSCIAAS